jgi:HYR domain
MTRVADHREETPMHLVNHTGLLRSVRRLAGVAMAALLGAHAAPAGAQTAVTLSLVPSAAVVGAGDQLDVVVRLNASTPAGQSPAVLLGVQGVMRFDPAVFEPVATSPIVANASGPFSTLNGGAYADAATGDVAFAVLDGTFQGFTGAQADVATLRLRVRSGVSPCGGAGLVRFATIGDNSTLLGVLPGGSTQLSLVDLPAVSFDRVAPVLSGVPASISQAADAGRSDGAVIAQPAVTAADGCDAAPVVGVQVTFPNGATAAGWPAVFPVGASTVRWTARDASGNESSATRFVVIQPFQLLDCSVAIQGAFDADGSPFTRVIRVTVRGQVFLCELEFLPFDPVATHFGIQVPVTTLPLCVAAKSVAHSLSDTAQAQVIGTRYLAEFSLPQGDSNDDDLVDILDFSMFVLAFGQPVSAENPSNFNADGIVNNADFGPIGINYFRSGERCEAFGGPSPRSRISVKELRRMGAGHLAAADLNHDGWVDQRDMQLFFASGSPAAGAED